MKLTLITLIAVLLTACSTQDKTYTVQELLKEPALYKKISDWCSGNPCLLYTSQQGNANSRHYCR